MWHDPITYKGRSCLKFPAAGALGQPIPIPSHPTTRKKTEVLDLLSQTQPNIPSTGEYCLDGLEIPGGEPEVNEVMAEDKPEPFLEWEETPLNRKESCPSQSTSTNTDTNTPLIRPKPKSVNYANTDTSQYPF